MSGMQRHSIALAAAAWLLSGVHAPAQSSSQDRWLFGAIQWCDGGDSKRGTYVGRHASGLDFLVRAATEPGELQFPAAFVIPLSGDECEPLSHGDPPQGTLLYLQYLNAGFRLAPAAVYKCTTGSHACEAGSSRTVVLAPSLSEHAIVAAITNRRVYASTDRNLGVQFLINGYPLGSVASMTPGTPLRIEVRLFDPDEPTAAYWVSLRHDNVGGPLEADREVSGTGLNGDGTIVFTQFRREEQDEYFLLEVTQRSGADENVVWTAPIWLVSPMNSITPARRP
jgi:hypothetical protein